MAEKMANSIGRELRYFEYKFRKKQSTKKSKKGKEPGPGPELAWSDSPRSDDFRFESEEIKQAAPSNKGEEDLQIQVALAMSREEEKERERQQESDKIRLEMAIKESANVGKPAKQTTLLDLSAERPPRVSAPLPTAGMSAPFASAATNDPWGSGASAPSGPSFDPFAPQTSMPAASASTDGFGMQNGGTWGAQPQAPSGNVDPWGSSAAFGAPVAAVAAPTFSSTQPTAPAFPPTQQSDPWGAEPATNQVQAQPVYATVQKGAWGNDPFSSNQAATNPILPTGQPTQNGDAWGMAPTTQSTGFDPFGGIPASAANPTFPTQQSTFETPPTFDPLKDFDSLRITNGNSEPSPVLLHKDFNATSSSVARDIFPVAQILEPQPIAGVGVAEPTSGVPAQVQSGQKSTTDQFLGENSGLVNFNSWQTYQLPYVTKPLGTVSHNPFAPTGPQKTLNEMKSGNQAQPFAQSTFH